MALFSLDKKWGTLNRIACEATSGSVCWKVQLWNWDNGVLLQGSFNPHAKYPKITFSWCVMAVIDSFIIPQSGQYLQHFLSIVDILLYSYSASTCWLPGFLFMWHSLACNNLVEDFQCFVPRKSANETSSCGFGALKNKTSHWKEMRSSSSAWEIPSLL